MSKAPDCTFGNVKLRPAREGAAPSNEKSKVAGNYRLGGLYSLVTAVLVATQEPFIKNLAELTVRFNFALCRLGMLYYVGLLALSSRIIDNGWIIKF